MVELQSPIIITPPGLESRLELPKHIEGHLLQFALLETGCSPQGKRGQLRAKRETLLASLKRMYDTDFKIYRGMTHYNGSENVPMDLKDYELDFLIKVICLTERFISSLSEEEIAELLGRIKKDEPRERVRQMIGVNNYRGLHDLIKEAGTDERYGPFRGRLAEKVIEKAIRATLKGINAPGKNQIIFIPNYYINGKDVSREECTEVDGIFAFYKPERLRLVLDILRGYYNKILAVQYNGALTNSH